MLVVNGRVGGGIVLNLGDHAAVARRVPEEGFVQQRVMILRDLTPEDREEVLQATDVGAGRLVSAPTGCQHAFGGTCNTKRLYQALQKMQRQKRNV